ncbi:hypothetical protein STENM327S_02295 [Streptomyces tendae]
MAVRARLLAEFLANVDRPGTRLEDMSLSFRGQVPVALLESRLLLGVGNSAPVPQSTAKPDRLPRVLQAPQPGTRAGRVIG